jgi:hypothetical protein
MMLTEAEITKLNKIYNFESKLVPMNKDHRAIIVDIAEDRKKVLNDAVAAANGDRPKIKAATTEHNNYIKGMLWILQIKSTTTISPVDFKVPVVNCYREYCLCLGKPGSNPANCQTVLTNCLAMNP